MYADDISDIPSGGCNYYNGSAIQHYSDIHSRQTYALNGRKWVKVAEDYSQYGYNMPSVCFDISTLHSNAALEPFFDLTALALGIFVFIFAWRLARPVFRGGYV